MGYTTEFIGGLRFNRELTHKEWLQLTELGDCYDSDIYAQYTSTPETLPTSYLQWIPNEDGTEYVWNGGEKFYDYVHWLRWVIKHYMKPHNLVLNGRLKWRGEELGDDGVILVIENKVTVHKSDAKTIKCPHCGERFLAEDAK